MIRTLVAAIRDQGWWVLVVVSLIGAGLWGFAELADEIEDGETHEFDRAVMLAMQGGPQWLDLVARDITSLGGTAVLVLLTVAALGYLLLVRKWSAAIFVAVSIVGGTLISTALKHIFDRPRPDVVPHAVEVTSASFPSGHAMLAMTTFLTLGAVLAEVQPTRSSRVYLISWAVLLALLVGTSRVYLGVHWPTDVLAGWCVGSAWALLCGSVALWLQRRGIIEAARPG
ncbi:MAG TPA: phosphatase PAP2 family protein [Steroidobacteraceae bacterium]|nr:phosphatase PAP2 family protein [Steroidobacteraceae bacterium]